MTMFKFAKGVSTHFRIARKRLWLGLACATIVATHAAAGLATDTLNHCENAKRLDDQLLAKLGRSGWRPVRTSDAPGFKALMTDGITAAMSGSRTTRINWRSTLPRAEKLASSFFDASQSRQNRTSVFLYQGKAALVVTQDPENANGFRCIYAGPIDRQLSDLLTSLGEMNKKAGLRQATPEVQLDILENLNSQRTISTQTALFVRPMDKHFGRKARVPFGFSLINLPTGW